MSDKQGQYEKSVNKSTVNPLKALLQVVLLLVLVVVGWFLRGMILPGGQPAGPPSGPPGGPGGPPMVVVETVRQEPVESASEYVGHVESIQAVDVCAQVAGYLDRVHFVEGSLVQEGDLLFTIQQAPYEARVALSEAAFAQSRANLEGARADLDATKANLDASRANLDRAEKYLRRLKNADERSIVQADLDAAESEVLQGRAQVKQCQAQIELKKTRIVQIEAAIQEAKANLDLARINLGYTEIQSPITGRIGKALVTKGNYVAPSTGRLARLVQVDPIRVLFSMSDREYLATTEQRVDSKNPPFKIQLRLPNETIYPAVGRWGYEDNEMDPATGTIAVRAVFDNPDGLLLSGQYVTVLIDESAPKVMPLTPQSAVLVNQQGHYVLVVDSENRAVARPITLGPAVGVKWGVESGLEAGETIIVQGIQKVRPGQAVQISPSQPEGR